MICKIITYEHDLDLVFEDQEEKIKEIAATDEELYICP